MKLKFYLLLTPLLLLSVAGTAQSLIEGFKNPPNEARPRGYWVLVNGNYSLSKMTDEIKEFKDKGMGGVDLWDVAGWVDENKVVPAGPQFMGEESMQAIAHGIREGKRLDMLMGFTLSSSWNAGGDWIKPEDGVMALYSSKTKLTGGQRIVEQLPFPDFAAKEFQALQALDTDSLPVNRKEVAVLAYPIFNGEQPTIKQKISTAKDISKAVVNGKLDWQAPSGDWIIERFVGIGTGQPLKDLVLTLMANADHFSKKAMDNNMEFLFAKLEDKLGDLKEAGLSYIYTDSYEANSGTWTADLPQQFEEKKGYSMLPYLPLLTDTSTTQSETKDRFLFDFNQVLSDLIIDNHYAYGVALSKEKGVGFIAEAGGPGPPVHNTPFESLRALGSLSAPRGEFWYDPGFGKANIERLQIIKGPASAAHLYNQPRVEAEAYTGTQIWQSGPGDLKQATDRALAEGLTGFIYHTTPHIPPEAGEPGWVYNFGTIINTTRTWWPKSKPFHEYIGRSCFLLQQGNFVGDVLFFYGEEAPNFIDHNANLKKLGFGYDYDGLNTDVLLNKLEVVNGKFTLPNGASYELLVMPDTDALSIAVTENLIEFGKKGGKVMANAPKKSVGLFNAQAKDKKVRELAKSLWGNKKLLKNTTGKLYPLNKKVPSVLEENGIQKDVSVSLANSAQKLRFIHRTSEAFDIYFLHNQTKEPLVFEATFRTTKGSPQLWDAYSGKMINQQVFKREANSTRMPMFLEGNASIFVVFQENDVHQGIAEIKSKAKVLFPNPKNTTALISQADGLIIDNPVYYQTVNANAYEVKEVKKQLPMAIGN